MLIYLLEDNPHEAAYFKDCMQARNHEVHHFERAGELLDALIRHRPSLVVLDWVVSDLTGFEVLKRVRDVYGQSLPVMMLTCMSLQENIVDALESGADDYMIKPLSRPVLVARIEALLRRSTPGPEPLREVQCGPYKLDYRQQRVLVGEERVALTQKEFDVAWTLFSNANRFMPKSDLVTAVWGKRADIAGHTLTQHIHTLRRKLKLQENGFRLVAVYGTGYRLEASAREPVAAAEADLAPA